MRSGLEHRIRLEGIIGAERRVETQDLSRAERYHAAQHCRGDRVFQADEQFFVGCRPGGFTLDLNRLNLDRQRQTAFQDQFVQDVLWAALALYIVGVEF